MDAFLEVSFAVGVFASGVEESVGALFEDFQFAAAAGFFDGGFECFSGCDGDELVVIAEQKEGWGSGRVDIVQGGEGLPEFGDPFVAVSVSAVVDDWVE